MGDIVYKKEYWAYMKIAKSYKILILLATFVLAISVAFGSMSFNSVSAATVDATATDYVISTVEGNAVNFSFDETDDTLVAKMKQGSAFEFKNKLVVDDFKIEFSAVDIASFTLDLTYDSFYFNGNKNAQGGFDKTIKQSIALTNANQSASISYADGYLIVKLDGNSTNVAKENDEYYKIRVVDKAIVTLGFTATTVSNADGADLKIISVDQNTKIEANGKYKQTFALEDGKLTKASPRIVLNNSFFTGNSTVGYSLVKSVNKEYSVTVTPYSVLGDKSSNTNIAVTSDVELVGSETSKKFKINNINKIGQTVALNIVDGEDVVLETYEINVVNGDKDSGAVDSVAPSYIDASANALAYEAYQYAINKAILVEDESHHVGLGYELELPTMQDLVYDDCTPYADLKVTLTHISTTTSTSSSLKFTISDVGNYLLYAVFSDGFDNKMDAKDIYDASDVENVKVTAQVFSFEMIEDAPLIVESFGGEGLGFKGVSYKAPSFKIDASGCTTNYKLYFNPSKTVALPDDSEELTAENGWVAIPKASSVTDKKYNKNGYTYEMIKAIKYDGELSFVPDKEGTYVIECSAVSKVNSRSSTGFSLVRVNSTSTIKLPSNWLQENVWSVVFLSIGTLCLAGIIVLLCIKPKEEIDED